MPNLAGKVAIVTGAGERAFECGHELPQFGFTPDEPALGHSLLLTRRVR